MARQARPTIAAALLLGVISTGCSDGEDPTSETSSTTTSATATTGEGPSAGAATSTTGEGNTAGCDTTTTGETSVGTSTSADSTTGGEASLCEAACQGIIDCGSDDLGEDLETCLLECAELQESVGALDPRHFPECDFLLTKWLTCAAETEQCDPDYGICWETSFTLDELCSCHRGVSVGDNSCEYHEECGVTFRWVHCVDGACTCFVDTEQVGTCDDFQQVCGHDHDGVAAAECCGWEPIEF